MVRIHWSDVLTVFTALGFSAAASGALPLVDPASAQSSPAVTLDVNIELENGISATGFVLLSEPITTSARDSKGLRALAYRIVVSKGDGPAFVFKGIPVVSCADRDAELTPRMSLFDRTPGTEPGPGTVVRTAQCGVLIEPTKNLNWGSVERADQISVRIEWDGK